MNYLCQLGELVQQAQLVRYVPMNRCQLGQLVPSAQLAGYVLMKRCHLGQLVPPAQLARYVLFMTIGPIGSTGPIGARN